MKDLTRNGQSITQQSMSNFISQLDIEDRVKEELMNISPFNYIGIIPAIKQNDY